MGSAWSQAHDCYGEPDVLGAGALPPATIAAAAARRGRDQHQSGLPWEEAEYIGGRGALSVGATPASQQYALIPIDDHVATTAVPLPQHIATDASTLQPIKITNMCLLSGTSTKQRRPWGREAENEQKKMLHAPRTQQMPFPLAMTCAPFCGVVRPLPPPCFYTGGRMSDGGVQLELSSVPSGLRRAEPTEAHALLDRIVSDESDDAAGDDSGDQCASAPQRDEHGGGVWDKHCPTAPLDILQRQETDDRWVSLCQDDLLCCGERGVAVSPLERMLRRVLPTTEESPESQFVIRAVLEILWYRSTGPAELSEWCAGTKVAETLAKRFGMSQIAPDQRFNAFSSTLSIVRMYRGETMLDADEANAAFRDCMLDVPTDTRVVVGVARCRAVRVTVSRCTAAATGSEPFTMELLRGRSTNKPAADDDAPTFRWDIANILPSGSPPGARLSVEDLTGIGTSGDGVCGLRVMAIGLQRFLLAGRVKTSMAVHLTALLPITIPYSPLRCLGLCGWTDPEAWKAVQTPHIMNQLPQLLEATVQYTLMVCCDTRVKFLHVAR